MNWSEIWETIKTFFTDNVWKIVGFFATLIFGVIIIKILLNLFRKLLGKTRMEKVSQKFLYNIIKFFLYLALILILLSIVGVSITGVLAAISAAVLAIGLALQNNIANLANGIIIVSSHMLKKGDYIIVDGVEGSVEEINFLFTTIMTTDNKRITIPNTTIINSSVINAGANATRRLEFTFSVAYETDVEKVKKIVIDVMQSDGRVLLEPKPFCRLRTLGASSIDFFANCWVDGEDYWDVYYYIIENVYNEFKRNKISIPYNQLEVRNRTDKVVMPFDKKPLQERVEKNREVKKHRINLEKDDLTDLFKRKKKKKDKKAKEEKVKINEPKIKGNDDANKENISEGIIKIDLSNKSNEPIKNTIEAKENKTEKQKNKKK